MTHSLHTVLVEHARRTPDAPALLAPGRTALTYRQLCAHVEATVRALNQLGVRRTDAVALVVPQGPELALSFLSVAAGAVTAPLNPGYTAAEFDFYLGDLGARALIVHARLDSPARLIAQKRGIPIVELTPLDDAGAGAFALHGEAGRPAVEGGFTADEDVALVLHTSGTTARPKIVPLTQRNIGTSAENIRRTLDLTPHDRCLNIMPLFHIHGLIGATLSSIAAGASVVCAPAFEAERFFEWLSEFRPTWYTAVPTMHQAIVAQAAAHRDVLESHRLRFIRSSSAAMPARVLAELERIFGAPVIEAYGMTEGAHQLASNPLPPRPRKGGSVGVAAGPEVAVMTGETLAAAGEVGEIVVRGRNVTGGYRDNPAANAAAFTHGWFRTGDQGYIDADGYVFITGRIKEIINRGGQKIAPVEVEEVLLDHPAVAQAAVFPMAHASLGEAVAAAVVFRPGTTATESEMQEFVLGRLAEYKVPSRVVSVSALPKGPTGKLQRMNMAAQLAAELQSDHVAPRTGAERELAALWADVLGVERVGVHDNFFSLGGDSLRAAQLFARIAKVFGTKLPPATLLRAATVEQLARLLHEPKMAQSSLVLVQAGGPKPPFYYVHGPGGDVLHLRKLAILLGRDRPCYGLQARGLYGTEPPHRRIEDMAAHYVAEIRAHQPQGPYFIGGFCFGGQIAYEMARQLDAQGEDVALVAMIDSYVRRFSDSSRAPAPQSHAVGRVARRLRFHAQTLRRLDRAGRWRYLATRVTNARTKLHIGFSRALDRAFARAGLPRPKALELRDLTLIHYEAGRSYEPRPYAGTVALFVTEESSEPAANDPRLAWKKLATGGARVYTIAGTHDTILEDAQLRQLAHHLKESLEDAQTRVAGRQSTAGPVS